MTAWQPIETVPKQCRVRVKWNTGQIHIGTLSQVRVSVPIGNNDHESRGTGVFKWEIEFFCEPHETPPLQPIDAPDLWAPLE